MYKFFLHILKFFLKLPHFVGAISLISIVFLFWTVRKWSDRRIEKQKDTEIVRSGEEYLGSWAQKSEQSTIQFRLKRNNAFICKITSDEHPDTLIYKGNYEIFWVNGDYQKLIAISDKGDTVFNHFITYLTPSGAYALVDGYDKLALNSQENSTTNDLVFYRIKKIQ